MREEIFTEQDLCYTKKRYFELPSNLLNAHIPFIEETIMELKWEDGFMIRNSINDQTVILSANREGLLSLAYQLMALASETPGSHVHYDEYTSLVDGSNELIIEKI